MVKHLRGDPLWVYPRHFDVAGRSGAAPNVSPRYEWINAGSVAGANYAFALSALALVFVLLGSVRWRAKAINAGFVFINFLLLLQVLFGL